VGYYFSLPHLGAGSAEVESLQCYFFRLARAHDCSPRQLISHLRSWSQSSNVGGTWPSISASLLDRGMALCGYSAATDRIANALVIATNVQTLRSGALLSLQHVAARTALRTIRLSRAWCPACYSEDLQERDEAFDRLLWALIPITRCSTHRILLKAQCPSCDAPQFYNATLRKIDECSSCGYSLVGSDRWREPAPIPTHGEKLIHGLIGASAANPNLKLHWESISAFYDKALQELSPNHPLTTRISFRRHSGYPTLGSLIELCTTFNISLIDFQSVEPPELTLPLYGPEDLPAIGRRHPKRTPATHAQVEAALTELLSSGRPLPPFREFCEHLGASKGYVSYRFPALAKTYLHARRIARDAARENNFRMAMRTLQMSGLWQAYCQRGMSQQKKLVRDLSRLASVSINVARIVVSTYEREQWQIGH
jgi:Zn ribbon nucleic-acid-binding protein